MLKSVWRAASSATLITFLSGNALAPSQAQQPIIQEMQIPLEGTFSDLRLSENFEKTINLWKTIYTETSDLVILNKRTSDILGIEKELKSAKKRKAQLEVILVSEKKGTYGDLKIVRGQATSFRQGYEKNLPWQGHIKRTYAEAGVHPQMADQAILESCYNHDAISSAKAVGAYQFLRGTAKPLLMINDSVDERLDPVRAARAAAILNRANYARSGHELLAVGTYNSGKGNYDRGIAFAQQILGPVDLDQLFEHVVMHFALQDKNVRKSYGFASSSYVPGLLGVIRGIEENFRPLTAEVEKEFNEIKIEYSTTKPITIDDLIRQAGITKAEIKDLNPALLSLRTEKSLRRIMPKRVSPNLPESYVLRLPIEKTQSFLDKFGYKLRNPQVIEVRGQGTYEINKFTTAGDIAYASIIDRRRQGQHSLITLADLDAVRSLYLKDLTQATDPKLVKWLETSIKVVEYDRLELNRELSSNYWSTVAEFRSRLSNPAFRTGSQ